MNKHQENIIRVTVNEIAQTMIEIANIKTERAEKALGRKLLDKETKQIAENVQRTTEMLLEIAVSSS
tara:strand:- start:38 stop:238 length:201 start_codon:yes stop_codon:yes gene_type:complete